MVTIKHYGEGVCKWCNKEKEGVEVETNDRSFTGFFCFPDLKRRLRLKCDGNTNGKVIEAK